MVALAPERAERIYAGKGPGAHVLTQEEINAALVRLGREHACVVRLKGGDPFVFGRGGEEALALEDAGIAWEVVPGVSSAHAVPAYAGHPRHPPRDGGAGDRGHRPRGSGQAGQRSRLGVAGTAPGTLVFLMGVGALARNAGG